MLIFQAFLSLVKIKSSEHFQGKSISIILFCYNYNSIPHHYTKLLIDILIFTFSIILKSTNFFFFPNKLCGFFIEHAAQKRRMKPQTSFKVHTELSESFLSSEFQEGKYDCRVNFKKKLIIQWNYWWNKVKLIKSFSDTLSVTSLSYSFHYQRNRQQF